MCPAKYSSDIVSLLEVVTDNELASALDITTRGTLSPLPFLSSTVLSLLDDRPLNMDIPSQEDTQNCHSTKSSSPVTTVVSSTSSLVNVSCFDWRTGYKLSVTSVVKLLTHLNAVDTLILCGMSRLTDNELVEICRHCTRVQSVDLSDCFLLTDHSIQVIANNWTQLVSLQLHGKRSIRDPIRLPALLCWCNQILSKSMNILVLTIGCRLSSAYRRVNLDAQFL